MWVIDLLMSLIIVIMSQPVSKCKLHTLNVYKFCQLYLNKADRREMIKQRKI